MSRACTLILLLLPAGLMAQLGAMHRFGHATNTGTDVLVADVDADGDNDLLQASLGRLLLHEQTGPGEFFVTRNYGVIDTVIGMRFADVDNDGVGDLVMMRPLTSEIIWMQGLGGGDLAPPTLLLTTSILRSIELADLNGDGLPDLLHATGVGAGGQLYWQENLGSGQFGTPQSVGACLTSTRLFQSPFNYGHQDHFLVEDLDGDGDLDVLAVVSLTTLGLWWNDGLGSFQTGTHPLAPHAIADPGGLAAGDLDGDGDPDLVVENLTIDNLGGGSFAVPVLVGLWVDRVFATDLGDVDADGDLDILTHLDPTLGYWVGSSLWTLNDGQGNLSYGPWVWSTRGGPVQRTGDLDGDGATDVAGFDADALLVKFGTSDRVRFGSVRRPHHVAVGDVDGDGEPDVVAGTLDRTIPFGGGPTLAIAEHLNLGMGILQEQGHELLLSSLYQGATSRNAYAVHLHDLDNDGDLDLIDQEAFLTQSPYTIRIMENLGGGTWGPPDSLTMIINDASVTPPVLHFDDLDGDGDLDISGIQNLLGGEVFVMVNQGGLSFSQPAGQAHTQPWAMFAMTMIDVDGDSDLDITWAAYDRLFWQENDGMGSFSNAQLLVPEGLAYNQLLEPLRRVDLDQDGLDDLVLQGLDSLLVYMNQGGGVFNALPATPDPEVQSFTVVDLDGDALPELVSLSPNGTFHLRINIGGSLQAPAIPVGQQEVLPHSHLTHADMDGDGDQDLVVCASVPFGDEPPNLLAWYAFDPFMVPLEEVSPLKHTPAARPNPFADQVLITFPEAVPLGERIEVLDLQGRIVRKLAGTGSTEILLGRGDLPEGTYLVRRTGGDAQVVVVVVQGGR